MGLSMRLERKKKRKEKEKRKKVSTFEGNCRSCQAASNGAVE
jgi:hypothetical protein